MSIDTEPRFPQGTPEYAAYVAGIREALKDPNAFAFLDERPLDADERRVARSMDAGDRKAVAAHLKRA